MANNEHIDLLISTLVAAGSRHKQEVFFSGLNEYGVTVRSAVQGFNSDPLACGSTACAAGWAIILSGTIEAVLNEIESSSSRHNCLNNDSQILAKHAQHYLGITAEQATFVFFTTLYADEPEKCAIAALELIKDNPDITLEKLSSLDEELKDIHEYWRDYP